ncbi:uncharacterized protein CXQ87_004801 [Candidozyma duobushaemuli]|nr:uncharacterized protein CXQ87_004801 [[Candida] duobushaemulonis]PVH16508.1 hypothetical protein CXQ87_004801 [[Candida] duobushaemulonis]
MLARKSILTLGYKGSTSLKASANIMKFQQIRQLSASVKPEMNWVEFFRLRKQNKMLNTAASICTAGLTAFGTLEYLGNIEIDIEKPIFGIDPFMILGGAVVLSGAVGYLFGPFIGTPLFNLTRSAILPSFKNKEEQFLRRIKRYRVDPSSQSFSNPVPDYYGERIYSLKTYKQWLRDCNAYKRKAKEFI